MSFLNPLMLAGLAAIAVPIIIHLLNRRRFHKVVWAAMRFLQISVEQNQRRMRIEDMILLALRCFLLVLLALALARPAILSQASAMFGRSKVTGVIVLDNSFSMGVSDGTQTRFDKAKRAAEQVLDSLPAGSATAILLASDIAQGAIPEPTFDLNLARKIVREAPLTDRATDLFPATQKAVDTLHGRLALRKEIYLITDGQATGWRHLTGIQEALEKSKSEMGTHIILVSEHEDRNLSVSELRLASGLSPAKQPLRFEVRVSNHGKEEARDVHVSLSVNSEPAGDEFTIASIPAGAAKSLSLFAKLPGPGFHSVMARIPEDRLHADDSRTVAVRAIQEVRVLLVDGDPGDEPRASEVFFLRHALVPVASEVAPEYFVKAVVNSVAEFSQARLDDFDAVVLANVSEIPVSSLKAIEGYLRRGGGLMIFPGTRVNPASYNENLFTQHQILPAELGAVRGEAGQDAVFFRLQEKDYDHPIASIWNDPAAGTLGSARFFRTFELKPEPVKEKGSVGAGEKTAAHSGPPSPALHHSLTSPPSGSLEDAGPSLVVLKYTDGTPAVVERTWSLGRVILFGSTADTEWNDLPVRPAFVPLIHRALGAIVQRQDEGLNLPVGGKFVRRVTPDFLDKDAMFFKPRQRDTVRDLRRIEMVNGWPALQYDQTDFAGVYETTVADPQLALKFATQADPAESNLEELSAVRVSTLKSAADILIWTPDFSLRGLVERSRTGLEFWLPLAVAALVVGLVETFLGQWFSRSK